VNDPDRRYSSEGFDDDAIFADIVAHLNDDVTDPDPRAERAAGPISEPEAGDAEADTRAPDQTPDQSAQQATDRSEDPRPDRATDEATGQATESIDLPWAVGPLGDPRQWSVNQPSWLPAEDDPAVPAPQTWRAHEVDDEFEDHFEPPPTSPLPAGDLQFWAIIAGMAGGPLLLLYLVFFNRDASGYWILTAIALSVGGFALLVSRMPGGREGDDNGARL
jgi:hypothetical protein